MLDKNEAPIKLPDQAEAPPARDDSITISQQSIYYFLIAVVFGVAGFIIGGVTFSTRTTSIDEIRNAAASGAREAVRSEIASLGSLINSGIDGGAAVPTAIPTPAVIDVAGAAMWGDANAKVTIVEYSDFECPWCGRFNRDTYDLIRSQYGDKVRYVFKHYPVPELHPNAERAAYASECANEQGRFWEYHDLLFNNQSDFSREALLRYAQDAQVNDIPAFTTCLDSEKYATKVQKDVLEAYNLGISGTPTFFINGLPLVGAQPFSAFRASIEQMLAAN